MSGYRKHFLAGLIVTVLAAFFIFYQHYMVLNWINCAWLLGISFVFSLLPDIDIGTSIIRKVFLIAFVIFIFIYGIGPVGYILGAVVIIIQFLPHRGIMHSYLTGILLAGLLWFVFHDWIFPVVAGLNFVSHLVLDEI